MADAPPSRQLTFNPDVETYEERKRRLEQETGGALPRGGYAQPGGIVGSNDPFLTSVANWGLPGFANIRGAINGDPYSAALGPLGGAARSAVGAIDHNNIGKAFTAGFDGAGGLVDDAGIPGLGGGDEAAAYAKKAEGYDAILARTAELKNERRADKDRAYALGMKAYDPSRKALAAVYGDPSTWRL